MKNIQDVLQKLKGGDRRSIGQADQVVQEVLEQPALFGVVFEGMLSEDPLIRMRAADVVEKVSADNPEYLVSHKARLLGEVVCIEQQEVRWHVAQMLPRLELESEEVDRAVCILLGYLEDESKIVVTFSMQALSELAGRWPRLLPVALPRIEELTNTGSPAMRSRGRKLLSKLDKIGKQ